VGRQLWWCLGVAVAIFDKHKNRSYWQKIGRLNEKPSQKSIFPGFDSFLLTAFWIAGTFSQRKHTLCMI
jgi:hypothetical protein